MSRTRFGLLGTGPWAAKTHGPALAAHEGADLVGVWGRRPEAASELASQLGTRPYDDAEALIADCDAVAIALPPEVQAPLAVRAARAGRHLLLDKPVATTRDGARRISEAVTHNGVAAVVFFTLRFTTSTSGWIDAQAAASGGLQLGRADWLSPVFAGSDSPYRVSPWRKDKGALWDVGPHALSVLLPVLGNVTAVRALRGAGDTVHLTLRHEDGASSTATLSHSVPAPGSGVSAEFRGEAGTARMPDRDEHPAVAYARAVDALLVSARTGEGHPCGVHFAERVTGVLARAEADLR